MKHCPRLFALVALLFAASIPASANIAAPQVETKPPRQTSATPLRMHLRPDAEAKEAKLIIPREVLRQLTAELDGGAGAQAGAAASSSSGGFNLSSAQTAAAGVFLSLSLVLGGVWFAGSRAAGRRAPRVASALAFVALGGAAGGAAVYANAGPPPVARKLTSRILIPDLSYWGASGSVKIEVANDNDTLITLVLPKDKAAASAGE